MRKTIERPSKAIVVSHRTDAFRLAVQSTREDQVIYDLVRLPETESLKAACHGLYW